MRKNKTKLNLLQILVFATTLSVGYYYFLNKQLKPEPVGINLIGNTNSSLAQPSIITLSGITESKMYFNDDRGIMNAEVTPWALETKKTGGWHTYLTSTYNTFMCTTPNNIFDLKNEDNLASRNNCTLRLEPGLKPNKFTSSNSVPLWYRDYHGTFSAHLISNANKDIQLYSINHSESYNNDSLAIRFPNQTTPPCIPVEDMGYGKLPCGSNNWWGSYNAWITLSRMPWTYNNLTSNKQFEDLGPITWPSNGYIESLDGNKTWIKATDGGIRHPTSIIKDNYLYVFYEDLSQGKESDGRGPGIKVIRAPITNGVVDPNSFKAYFNGNFTENSLPAGFNLPTYYSSLNQKGPRASSLFPELTKTAPQPTLGTKRTGARQVGDIVSFSVARVEGTDYYLGVAHELSRGVTLRLSRDLTSWSNPVVVPGTAENWWLGKTDLQKYPLLYPRLANKNGDSNVSINPNEFYIIGTQTKPRNSSEAKVVNQIKLKLSL